MDNSNSNMQRKDLPSEPKDLSSSGNGSESPAVMDSKALEAGYGSTANTATDTPAGTKRSLGTILGFTALKQRYDARFPPYSTYWLGKQRRFWEWVVAGVLGGVLVLAIALGVGLGVGLKGSSGSSSSSSLTPGTTQTGDLTYYAPGLGACGITSSSSQMIVAVSHVLFDAAANSSDPNSNPLCGRMIRVQRDGKSVDVEVVDRCVGCESEDLDLSPGAFEKLADEALGRVEGTWAWLS